MAETSARPVVWDYHVVLLLRPRYDTQIVATDVDGAIGTDPQSWVYDFDSRLDIPCALEGMSRRLHFYYISYWTYRLYELHVPGGHTRVSEVS